MKKVKKTMKPRARRERDFVVVDPATHLRLKVLSANLERHIGVIVARSVLHGSPYAAAEVLLADSVLADQPGAAARLRRLMREHLAIAEEMRALSVHVFELTELNARAASLRAWSEQVHAAAAAKAEAAETPREAAKA